MLGLLQIGAAAGDGDDEPEQARAPARSFPLHLDGAEPMRFRYALFLLNKVGGVPVLAVRALCWRPLCKGACCVSCAVHVLQNCSNAGARILPLAPCDNSHGCTMLLLITCSEGLQDPACQCYIFLLRMGASLLKERTWRLARQRC